MLFACIDSPCADPCVSVQQHELSRDSARVHVVHEASNRTVPFNPQRDLCVVLETHQSFYVSNKEMTLGRTDVCVCARA